MKSLFAKLDSRITRRFALFMILVGIISAVPLLSGARTAPATNITIVNNSSREMRHVYLSSVNQDNWGPDQLNNSVIAAGGGSFTLSNVACSGADIKVIAEDADGCFVYQVGTCGDSVNWTITNDATPDCGQ